MYRSSAAHFHPPPPPPPLPPPLPLLLSQSGCWILDHIPPLNLISITAGLNWWENPCWFHLIAFIYHFVVVVVVVAAAAAAAAVVLFGWWNVFWLFALSAWAFRVTGRSTRWNWSDSSELSGRGQSRLPDQVIPPRSPEGRPTRTVHVHSGPILMIYSKLKKKKKKKTKNELCWRRRRLHISCFKFLVTMYRSENWPVWNLLVSSPAAGVADREPISRVTRNHWVIFFSKKTKISKRKKKKGRKSLIWTLLRVFTTTRCMFQKWDCVNLLRNLIKLSPGRLISTGR